jgi:hypothetical protein
MTQCPLATGMTEISRPKGKYSVHQGAPKHLLITHPPCSESTNCADLLSPGALACLMPSFPSACRDGECPQLRPCSVPSCPGFYILQTGSVQVQFSSQVSRPASSFGPLDLHEKGSTYAHYKFAARFGYWYCSSARKMVLTDQIRFEPPGGAGGELPPM